MAWRDQVQKLFSNVLGLGARRLAALGIIGVTVFGLVALGAVYLNRAEQEVLYSGLEQGDVARIGAALGEAGIAFDVNAAGDSVLVKIGETRRARMLLAEQGLPNGAGAGYELFDRLGSLGLTSFMQEVTRVRAMEGELARTIQLMKGVKAARVHLVMPDEGSFRRGRQAPSASVVLRAESPAEAGTASAVQNLVAAAVPGMSASQVTVLTTDGTLMAGGDGELTAPANMIGLEQTVSARIRENIRQTLMPYLGLENFQVSVSANLNADKSQMNETIFDPDSRVERSTRVIRQNEIAQNRSGDTPTTVEQNLPEEEIEPGTGERSDSQSERREELTNYEISTRTVTTVSDGYRIDRLSVAVLIDHEALAGSLGKTGGATEIGPEMEARIDEIRTLVASAAGLDEARGDMMAISAVSFHAGTRELAPLPQPGLLEIVARQSGTLINAGTILLVSLLVIWFGLRPATKALLARTGEARMAEAARLADEGAPAGADAPEAEDTPDLLGDLASRLARSPQKRLAQIVELDEARAAALLREWIYQDQRA
ncbi:MAG TPA: flagellar basal-body MS-ring/collar protein FliF [Paracoccaceae bacterium]|nr:flagellar basal-body MS-ring/collar protein FliF [Paracoccaceae bacterium]